MREIQQTYHIPGTLTADLVIAFAAAEGMTLKHVSTYNNGECDGTFTLGDASNPAAHMAMQYMATGSGDPAQYSREDFVNKDYPHIEKGETFRILIDYDGTAGVAAKDLTLVLTFAVG